MRGLRSGPLLLFLLQLHGLSSFVLTGANSSSHSGQLRSLPGTSFRWTVPAEQANTDGLGGGLFWALDPQFCEKMLTMFPERNIFLGVDFLDVDFLNCDDIKAALLRGFATWSDNHRLLNFVDISESAPCMAANRSADRSDPCPWEVYITTDDGSAHPDLAAYVTTFRASHFDQLWFTQPLRSSSGVIAFGVDANRRSMMRFQTHICWYLDATFCYHLQRLKHESAMGTADIDLFVRLTLLMLFAMAATRMLWTLFFVCVALFCVRGEAATAAAYRRHGRCSGRCSMMLDYLSSLSPGGNVLVLFFLIFPPIFYQRIYLPCIECYDFEAAMAHETGHVLGFDHPDQRADENLVAGEACAVNNATCRDAFGCAVNVPYEPSDMSIMHSLTRHSPRTCLSEHDLQGIHFLYPLCDDLQPVKVVCTKAQQLSGWLRLAVVVGVPFGLACVAILVPLTCLRWRDQRHMRQLTLAVGTAQQQIWHHQQTIDTLRSTARDAVRPMTAAFQRQISSVVRPATASMRRGSVAGGRSGGRVAPSDNPPRGTSTEEPERQRSPNAPETLMIEDMAEGEPAEVRRPPLRNNGYAVKGGSTASPSKVAFAESLGNGYTGPVWPTSQ